MTLNIINCLIDFNIFEMENLGLIEDIIECNNNNISPTIAIVIFYCILEYFFIITLFGYMREKLSYKMTVNFALLTKKLVGRTIINKT